MLWSVPIRVHNINIDNSRPVKECRPYIGEEMVMVVVLEIAFLFRITVSLSKESRRRVYGFRTPVKVVCTSLFFWIKYRNLRI